MELLSELRSSWSLLFLPFLLLCHTFVAVAWDFDFESRWDYNEERMQIGKRDGDGDGTRVFPQSRLRTSRRSVRCCKLQCELCTMSLSLLVQFLRIVSAQAASVLAFWLSTFTSADQSETCGWFSCVTLWLSPCAELFFFFLILWCCLERAIRASSVFCNTFGNFEVLFLSTLSKVFILFFIYLMILQSSSARFFVDFVTVQKSMYALAFWHRVVLGGHVLAS